MNERIWTLAEQNMARRERTRLIRKGDISFRSVPNVLVLVDGGTEADASWKFPLLSVREGATVKAVG